MNAYIISYGFDDNFPSTMIYLNKDTAEEVFNTFIKGNSVIADVWSAQ